MKAHIIYQRYYDFENGMILTGGVQTYITNLVSVLVNVGYTIEIFQGAKSDTYISLPNITVHGYCMPSNNDWAKNAAILVERSSKTFDNTNDLLIFASDELCVHNNAKKSIAIQHGIYWDVPKTSVRNDYRMALSSALFTYNVHKRLSYVKTVICVDYNFMNWYRAQVDRVNADCIVIPNFTEIPKTKAMKSEKVSVIFARRLYEYRGTRVFCLAIQKILDEFDNVTITIAGRGPDEQYMHGCLDKYGDKVLFTQYSSEESLMIHSDKHIAVIPTVGSEGTSLSLLEAMASQCAVICTDVGGMTNIVINGYNGIMVKAGDSVQLYEAIKQLIFDPKYREQIAKTGYDTVQCAFSLEKWSEKWRSVISNLR